MRRQYHIRILDSDEIELTLSDSYGNDTGILVATLPPDRYQTAGSSIQTRPDIPQARLLSAAPAMLEALEKIWRGEWGLDGTDTAGEMRKLAFAAIQAATGEEKP